MITTGDIGDILYRDCRAFGIGEIQRAYNIANGEIKSERVVIIQSPQSSTAIWHKCIAQVNIVVPDLADNVSDLIRLGELEHRAWDILDDVCGEYKEDSYIYGIQSIGIEHDSQLRAGYVNVKIIFQVLNVK